MRNLIFAFICLLLVIPCQAEIITVDDDGPADFNNIQAAIDNSSDGDEIVAADGTYTGPGNRDIDFLGKAIKVRSESGPENCIIDCNGTEDEPHRGFDFHSEEDADSVLEGLTIINGWDFVGAGISCDGASPTIMHCLISGNTSRFHGGGLYCRSSSPVIANCTLRDNTAEHGHGGGIFCLGGSPDISTCIISDNSAGSSGGGLFNNNSSPVLLDCDFTDNSAGDYGGGVCNTNNSIPTMTDCTFSDNRADYCGDDTYSEGEPCIDLNRRVTDAKMYNIMSSGGLSGKYQVSGSSGTVYYVNGLCGNDSWSGLDPCCVGPDGPKQTIQAAIDDADNGETIIVFPHIYFENIEMEGNDISLTSIDPNDPNVVETTVIDGGGWGSVVTFAGTEGPNCLLTGFTITNGYFENGYGGGINGAGTQATIIKCVITGNDAFWLSGGGLYGCNGPIIGCTITNNTADQAGGGLLNCQGPITGCIIQGNRAYAEMGGGLYGCNGPITNCIIIDNIADDFGGGLQSCNGPITNCIISGNYVVEECGGGLSNCRGPISNCLISGNRARYGGGLYLVKSITNCVVSGNLAYEGGGGLDGCGLLGECQITNCIITSNVAVGGFGGGLYAYASTTVTGSTIANNVAGQSGGGVYSSMAGATVVNCVLWGNRDNSGQNESGQIVVGRPAIVRYSCIKDDNPNDVNVPFGGAINGNIDTDPCFADPCNGDFRLLPSSPCIDSGDNDSIPADTPDLDGDGDTGEQIPLDTEGNPRIVDGNNDGESVVDMGAYEFFPAIEVSMRFTPPALNPFSQGKWIKAHLVLPEGFAVEDVDENTPALLEPFGIESDHINVFVNEDGLVEIEAAFDRAAFCEARVNDEATEVRVIGLFTNGEYFYGTDTIRIINGGLKYVAVLASHWLEAGCGMPGWCEGADLNHSSTVDFIDFALFDGCCIEVVKD